MKSHRIGHHTSQEVVNVVKGVSKQVIVVHSPDPKLFEQAIFILRENAQTVTDEQLLKEANRALHSVRPEKARGGWYLQGAVWACGGAALTGMAWLLTALL